MDLSILGSDILCPAFMFLWSVVTTAGIGTSTWMMDYMNCVNVCDRAQDIDPTRVRQACAAKCKCYMGICDASTVH